MATRPVFLPTPGLFPYVTGKNVDFVWHSGFSIVQTQRSIRSLHDAAADRGWAPLLEISSKSLVPLGVSLSAFNLRLEYRNRTMSVECAFQGSKVFRDGGPYTDLYSAGSREAKKDPRLRSSGEVVEFRFLGDRFPTQPVTVFYDWLYILALSQNRELSDRLSQYAGFTDIAFNPKRSWNCQARSAALYVALAEMGEAETVLSDFDFYLELVSNEEQSSRRPPDPADGQLRMPW